MKKLFVAVAVIVVLLVGAVVALPSLVPADKIKDQVIAQVKTATGRDLSIQGKVAVSAFPSLGVAVNNIALANPPGFSSKELVRLGALDVKLKLMPLLSGRVEIDSFVLVDPVITLEVDRKGKPNWQFDAPAATMPQAKAEPGKPATTGDGAAAAGLGDLSLGDVRITNGKLTYIDGPAGTKEEVDGINLLVSLKSLDDPLSVKGGLNWRAKAIELGLNLAKPRALVEGKASNAEIMVNSDAVKLGFRGEASGGATPGAKGALELSVPSVRALALWATGKPLAMEGSGLGPFTLTGQLTAQGAKVALTQANIGLDAIKAKGDFAVDAGGARPALKGKLDVDALDLNPYLPPEKAGPAGAAPAPSGGGKAAKADWSDEPIDASGLKAADVDFALGLGSLTVKKIKIGKSALHVVLNNGRMTADLSELALYKGAGKGRVVLDGSQPGIGLDAGFALKGLQAEPFLTDAADFTRLEGTGNFDIQVAGRGRTERQVVSSLDGKGAVSFLDGAIKGINLAEMVRNVTTAFSGSGGAQKTDFAELGGTFTITDGIVKNQDLALKSPLLRVDGKGTVELPPRTVHYRIEPKAVASLEGQGGKSDLGGVQVPVIVEGAWDNLSYRPDLEAMVKGQAGKAIQDAIGGKTGGVGGLLGGSSGSGEQKTSPLPINPGGLFGR